MPQTTIYSSPRSLGAPEQLPPAVATHELARLFGGNAALAGISISIQPGRLVLLAGPNGAGKTTLLRILATAIRPSFGSATVDGIDLATHPALVRARTAFLSHATALYDDLTARENLAFSATMLGLVGDPARERVSNALAEIGLTDAADRRVRGLSAGMRRRLALGRVLLARPSLVLLDEPFAALDVEGMQLVEHLLDTWRREGVTVLVASHAAEHLSSRLDGTIQLSGGVVADVSGNGVVARPPIASPVSAPAMEGLS